MKQLLWVACLSVVCVATVYGQNTRLREDNAVGWYGFFGTVRLSDKLGLHTEYQWRRDHLITHWQQSLLRLGINYQLDPAVQLRLGYAWIETFPYGEYPLNPLGRDFTEHRSYQMLTITDKVWHIDLSHRLMLEQRWLGKYTTPNAASEDAYVYANRLRYMLRAQLPLKGAAMADKTPYLAVYDEILIGFGRNVNENVFDQNRLGGVLGYRFSRRLRLEAGYLSQIVQLGREVAGRNVFQHNHALLVSSFVQL